MDDLDILPNEDMVHDAHLMTYHHSSKRFVGFMIGLTLILVFSTGIIIDLFQENNPFSVKPTNSALAVSYTHLTLPTNC